MPRLVLLLCLFLPVAALASGAETMERFPPPDFGESYAFPTTTQEPARSGWMAWMDVGVLVLALAAASWAVLRQRSRKSVIALALFCLVYFGFFRKGCVCPIGAISNISLALFDPTYALPLHVLFFFLLPLFFALLFGRVFCSGVCPLGALQDLILVRNLRVPRALDEALRLLRYFYLAFAVLFAALGTRFLICQYDPFVGVFRLSAPFVIWIWSAVVIGLALFVGRPYCRYLCPYGALLGLLSRFSWKRVTITPEECVVCGLCSDACPFNAIREADDAS